MGQLNLNDAIVIIIVAIVFVFITIFRINRRLIITINLVPWILILFILSRGLRGAHVASRTTCWQRWGDTVIVIIRIRMVVQWRWMSTTSITCSHVKRNQRHGLTQRARYVLALGLEQILVGSNYGWSQLHLTMQTNEGTTGRNTHDILPRIAVQIGGKLCQLGLHQLIVERDRRDVKSFRHGGLSWIMELWLNENATHEKHLFINNGIHQKSKSDVQIHMVRYCTDLDLVPAYLIPKYQ